MGWLIGIDEAGYGPNLGPFVMSAVACRVPDALAGTCLWQALAAAVRRGGLPPRVADLPAATGGRLVVDDSKVVHAGVRGMEDLERGVLAVLGAEPPATLDTLLESLLCDPTELHAEPWYQGNSSVPAHVAAADLASDQRSFADACAAAGIAPWKLTSVVTGVQRFNAVAEAADSKGAVLAEALGGLLRRLLALLPGTDELCFFVDKHGGRNTYAALLQHALQTGYVVAGPEGPLRSVYSVLGLRRPVRLTFQPRADGEHFGVALASMASKYLRERLMGEFNRFWQGHVPGLRPTAGYPSDAVRFLDAIRPAAARLGIAEEVLWRRR
jgi:hypothetical protein